MSPKLSQTAENLIPSEIRKISAAVDKRKEQGEKLFNFTIGDFDSKVFPIPEGLKEEIKKAYDENLTNYPPTPGVSDLRKSISEYMKLRGGFEFSPEEILIASGGRPISYTVFKTLINPGENFIYPAPSWNNNCYVNLMDAKHIAIETKPEDNFLFTASDILPYIESAGIISINSPMNPTGTAFRKDTFKEILDVVVEENKRRKKSEKKPLYIYFDMIYWLLVYGETIHYNPIELNPEIRDYIIFMDGISKCFAATGVRVGWGFGPKEIINKMSVILSHIGAWAPKPEQTALARFLRKNDEVDSYLDNFKEELLFRLKEFYNGIKKLKNSGHDVDAIEPQGALYLTVKLNLIGKKTQNGKILRSVDDITEFILEDAKIALVPFYAFGASRSSVWYRLSVGTCSRDEVKEALLNLKRCLVKLDN